MRAGGPRIAHAQAWCGVNYGHSLFRRLLTLSPGPCPCLAPCIPPHTPRLRRSRRTHGRCSRALSHSRTRSRTLSRVGLERAPWPAGEMWPLQAGRAECLVRAARLSALGALSTLSSPPARQQPPPAKPRGRRRVFSLSATLRNLILHKPSKPFSLGLPTLMPALTPPAPVWSKARAAQMRWSPSLRALVLGAVC